MSTMKANNGTPAGSYQKSSTSSFSFSKKSNLDHEGITLAVDNPVNQCNGFAASTPVDAIPTAHAHLRRQNESTPRVTGQQNYFHFDPTTTLSVAPSGQLNPWSNGYSQRPRQVLPALSTKQEWTKWHEVSVKLEGIPFNTTIREIYQSMEAYGRIESIRIPRLSQKDLAGHAYISFSPAPTSAFWISGEINLLVQGEPKRVHIFNQSPRHSRMISSPTRANVRYPELTVLRLNSLDFGFMSNDRSMAVMKTIKNEVFYPTLTINLKYKRLELKFTCFIEDPRRNQPRIQVVNEPIGTREELLPEFKAEFQFRHLKKIFHVEMDQDYWCLIINQQHPPRIWKRRRSVDESHKGDKWGDIDSWARTTEISYADWAKQYPISLQEPFPFIDIGKWTTYRLLFRKSDAPAWNLMRSALADFNIQVIPTNDATFNWEQGRPSNFRKFIDDPIVEGANDHLALLHRTDKIELSFEVRYQLEAAISQGVFTEQSLTPEFLRRLSELDSAKAKDVQTSFINHGTNGLVVTQASQKAKLCNKAKNILEYVTEAEMPVYDPMTVFQTRLALTHHTFMTLPDYCTWVRKIIVTPSKVYLSSPSPETTNRVLRNYAKEGDRFLRVQFTDERNEGKIHAQADSDVNDGLFNRVYRVLRNGIQIGDRHYDFLAFGNSQFREHGAYFFCPTATVSCDDIREWMGDFSHINIVAKYASRLGLCFSTTRDPRGVGLGTQVLTIPDIENNGWCFSDGVGMISPWLAEQVTKKLKMFDEHGKVPSAFQFRHGGSKGILVTWPQVKFNEICLRPSQQKFTASARNLEIIRCSRFTVAALNRQTIAILSCLGVPDEAFIDLAKNQLSDYTTAMTDPDVALKLLRQFVDENGTTTTIAQMITDGFMESKEPFTKTLLQLWRAWSMKLLREKARIVVENGAFVLGCVDETNTLRGQRDVMETNISRVRSKLPQVFLQVSITGQPGGYRVIKGVCIVGRNPSLHPGDLRVVEAVDVDNDQLKTIRNVLVFPSNGDRDVASMCSGGDLDGDDYFIFWDPTLIPREWNHPPMMHNAIQPKRNEKSVTIRDISRFFVEYLKNDSLSTIALAHVAWADRASAKSPQCFELAKLHSNAVDYVKTGQPAHMDKELRPRCWPHFMERDPQKSYKSRSILGQLYDLVAKVDFTPDFEGLFDSRILRRYQLSDGILKLARTIKTHYDLAMRRIMNQREIETEFEVWSTFVMTKPRVGSDYKVQEDMGLVMNGLRDRFTQACFEQVGQLEEYSINNRTKTTGQAGVETSTKSAIITIPNSAEARDIPEVDKQNLYPFIAAMYRVTWEEVQITIQEWRETRIIAGRRVPKRPRNQVPFISFPWLFEADLGRIATSATTGITELSELPSAPILTTVQTVEEAMEIVAASLVDGRLFHRGDEILHTHHDLEENEENFSHSDQGSTPLEGEVEAATTQMAPPFRLEKIDVSEQPNAARKEAEEDAEEIEEVEDEVDISHTTARLEALQRLGCDSD